jgi:hypothetical protein
MWKKKKSRTEPEKPATKCHICDRELYKDDFGWSAKALCSEHTCRIIGPDYAHIPRYKVEQIAELFRTLVDRLVKMHGVSEDLDFITELRRLIKDIEFLRDKEDLPYWERNKI